MVSSAEQPGPRAQSEAFVAKINGALHGVGHVEWHNYRDIAMEFGKNRLTAYLVPGGDELDKFAFVYFKSYFRFHEQAAAIAEYLDEKRIPFLSSELRHYISLSKLTQMARLARAGLPIPDTIFMPTSRIAETYSYVRDILGLPFILKAIDGYGGRYNYLIQSKVQLQKVLQTTPEKAFITQHFIENTYDLRVLIVGGKIALVIKRARRSSATHVNNVSQGAQVKLLDVGVLSPAVRKLAIRATRIIGRENAGVDLLFDNASGEPVVLEVNADPQIASGAFVNEKLQVYSNIFRNML